MEAARHDRHANRGAHNTVRARHRIVQDGGDDEPDTAAEQSAHVAEHELDLGALEDHRIEDALANGAAHLGADQYRPEYLEDGGQDARLLEREYLGAHTRAEGVGHVVGADAEGEHECDHEAGYDQPELSVAQIHDALLLLCIQRMQLFSRYFNDKIDV